MASGQQPARGDQSTDNPHRASHAALQQAGPLLTPPCASALPVASLQYGAAGLSFSAGGTGNGASGNEWGSQGRGAAGIFFDNSRAQVIPGNVDPRVGGSLMGHASMSVGAGVPRGTDGGEITAAASDGSSFDARFPPTLSGIETSMDTESSLMSAEMAKSNSIAVLAEKLTAAQGTTSTAVAELVAAREAATVAASTAPASTRSEKEIADEQHAHDRNKAKAIKACLALSLLSTFLLRPRLSTAQPGVFLTMTLSDSLQRLFATWLSCDVPV